jgi:hypothetical protein
MKARLNRSPQAAPAAPTVAAPTMAAQIARSASRLALIAALAIVPASLAAGLETEATLDALPTAALGQEGGTSMQTEETRLLAQVAASHKQSLGEGLSLSGTFWADADSLPSGSPLQTPTDKLKLTSRLLEIGLEWEALPGQLIVDVGKKIIHPSSGFFKTPLNLLSRGSASGLIPSTGAAVSTWEEGWVGADVTYLTGNVTIANFLSPRLEWSDSADRTLQYLSQQQEGFNDLLRFGLRIGKADVRLLALTSSGGAGGADSDFHLCLGAGADTNVGDSLTLRAECSVADSRDRLAVVDEELLASREESVAWAPRALAGFTWTGPNELSVMAEYYYNGLGMIGSDYDRLIHYSVNRLAVLGTAAPGARAPDVLDQFGSFEAARHYGFARVSGQLETDLAPALFSVVNLQDCSGITGANLTYTRDAWALSGSIVDYWGGKDTEAGLSPVLWQIDVQLSLFF